MRADGMERGSGRNSNRRLGPCSSIRVVDAEHRYGYDSYTTSHTEVVPRPPPILWHWRIGPVDVKLISPTPGQPGTPATGKEEITVQLTADQQVELSISGEDAYGNPVDISGDVAWLSSDESIIAVEMTSTSTATAAAVGPAGTASVTVTNDADRDGTGDFMGSIAIDVVAGDITEIAVTAGAPTDKPT